VTEPLCSGDLSGDDNICENLEEYGQTALQLFDTLIDALAQLHSTGWMHRDVFPGNIGEDEERFRLLDLGNAMRINTAQKTEMRHVGTTKWCSMRAHAILNGIRGDSVSWEWRPRDDLESVYFLFAERLSRPGELTEVKMKRIMARYPRRHCEICEDQEGNWSTENLQGMRDRLSLLQEALFGQGEESQGPEDVCAVSQGQDDFTRSPDALEIRKKIKELMVTPSNCQNSTELSNDCMYSAGADALSHIHFLMPQAQRCTSA